ncbi:type III secretion system outer membrane ring subunit SctC [Pseudomonas indica]|uniref:Type 3 secretion system secretin n=1 Tax=Pseudomonas indica TaxID=137658 RepID=A0A1G9J626_9PSED|nr:type III secretion system outer membrane ring subunit SctC [Pseudomonas indica]PAU60065.1 EscC/YscC/HrcC family type III secretion system outer membrane ring protein [Pseudomonas indica]SDL32801.1 type III secretion protein C [Pseudomonas indica]
MRNVLLALPLLAGLSMSAVAAIPADWRKGAYAYEAEGASLASVLEDFAQSHGVKLRIGNVSGAVDAKIRADNAEAFLDRLALEHRFQWFVYNGTLFISPIEELTSVRLEVSPEAAPDLKQALTDIGLLDSRFGWGELPDEGVVLVTGPARYVQLIRRFSKERVKGDERQQVMVFPLRYSAVADREIQYRDQSLQIPGVARLLAGLMGTEGGASGGTSPSASFGGINEALQSAMSMAEKANSSAMGLAVKETPPLSPLKVGGSGRSGKGRVVADVRNNAILVWDDLKRRDMYQQVIDRLDVPQNLVEIDALILDIDREEIERLGSSWQARIGNIFGGTSIPGGGSSTLFIGDFKRFFAELQALQEKGVASIVANPSVLTLENQPAVIDFSRTAFITAVGERVADIQPVTAGTSLRVIPRAIDQGAHKSIQLIVDIEDGQVELNREGGASGMKRGTVGTQAVIDEQRSLVIGGFHSEESGDRDRRIPLLGDIPWIGQLFTSTRRETSRRERLFILTPKLIGDQTNPVRYVGADDRERLDEALVRVQRRHGNGNLRAKLENVMLDLVKGRLPAGLEPGAPSLALDTLCRPQAGIQFDAERRQWFSDKEFNVGVGVVRNAGDKAVQFDEAACGGENTLAVTLWPRSRLEPGEASEIFVALRKQIVNTPARASLLVP